jgi:hypothetical protein
VSVINTVNKCNKYNELISAYIDNELNEDDRAVLDAHLETCDECRKYLKLLQSVSSSAGNTLVQPPEKLAEGIMYKAKLESSHKHFRRFPFGRYTAIAAVFCLVMLGAYKIIPLFNKADTKNAAADYSMADTEAADKGSGSAEAQIYGAAADMDTGGAGDAMPSAGEAAEYKSGSDTDSGKAERNYIIPTEEEAKSEEGTATTMMMALAPSDSEASISQASPEYDEENTRGYKIYKNLKYDERFYSVCFIFGPVPDKLDDCEVLYTGEGQTHYKVPLETMLDLEIAEAFDEIYYDNLSADYGLVIVVNE